MTIRVVIEGTVMKPATATIKLTSKDCGAGSVAEPKRLLTPPTEKNGPSP